MITRIIFLLCFVTLLQPVWDLPLPRPDGKNLIFLLIIHLQFFSALLSVFLFIYSNSKIAFKLLVVFFVFFFLVHQERYGLLGDAIAAMIKTVFL